MAQFDSLIISPLLWVLMLSLFFHYYVVMEILIPDFFGAKKFRGKKLNLSNFFGSYYLVKGKSLYNKGF
jgi:hypothetical protein